MERTPTDKEGWDSLRGLFGSRSETQSGGWATHTCRARGQQHSLLELATCTGQVRVSGKGSPASLEMCLLWRVTVGRDVIGRKVHCTWEQCSDRTLDESHGLPWSRHFVQQTGATPGWTEALFPAYHLYPSNHPSAIHRSPTSSIFLLAIFMAFLIYCTYSALNFTCTAIRFSPAVSLCKAYRLNQQHVLSKDTGN